MKFIRFLWMTIFPTIGVLATGFLLLYAGTEIFYASTYKQEAEKYKTEVLHRISSPDGKVDAIVSSLPYWRAQASLTVVSADTSEPDIQYGRDISFPWSYEAEPLPISIEWITDRVLKITYCGVRVSGSNVITTPAGSFDVELERSEGCDAYVTGRQPGVAISFVQG